MLLHNNMKTINGVFWICFFSVIVLVFSMGDEALSPTTDTSHIAYFNIDSGHIQPSYVDQKSKVVYLWSGVLLKRELIELPSNAPGNRRRILELDKSMFPGYSFVSWSPKAVYRETNPGEYLKGYYDDFNGLFFQIDSQHYNKSEFGSSESARVLKKSSARTIDLSNQ